MLRFTRPLRPLSLAALGASAALLVAAAGCQEKGAFETAGENVDDAVRDAGDAIEDAGDDIEDALEGDG